MRLYSADITGSLIVEGPVVDFTNTSAISGSIFSGSFVGDGSGLIGTDSGSWDGIFTGSADITGSLRITGSLDTTGAAVFGGSVTATNLSGTNTGDQTNITGNAGTATLAAGATILETARNINSVAFDGSADITIVDATKLPLAGGTLTGALIVENNAITQDGTRPILTLQQSGTTKVFLGISSGASDLVIGDASGDAVFRKPASSGAFRFSVDGGTSSAFTIGATGAVGINSYTSTIPLEIKRFAGSGGTLRLIGNDSVVGMPSISFLNDNGGGGASIGMTSLNQLNLNGSIYVNPTGNVGIGTSTISSTYGFTRTLAVSNPTNAELQLEATTSGKVLSIGVTNGMNYFQTSASNGYDFQTGTTSKFNISSGGVVTQTMDSTTSLSHLWSQGVPLQNTWYTVYTYSQYDSVCFFAMVSFENDSGDGANTSAMFATNSDPAYGAGFGVERISGSTGLEAQRSGNSFQVRQTSSNAVNSTRLNVRFITIN